MNALYIEREQDTVPVVSSRKKGEIQKYDPEQQQVRRARPKGGSVETYVHLIATAQKNRAGKI